MTCSRERDFAETAHFARAREFGDRRQKERAASLGTSSMDPDGRAIPDSDRTARTDFGVRENLRTRHEHVRIPSRAALEKCLYRAGAFSLADFLSITILQEDRPPHSPSVRLPLPWWTPASSFRHGGPDCPLSGGRICGMLKLTLAHRISETRRDFPKEDHHASCSKIRFNSGSVGFQDRPGRHDRRGFARRRGCQRGEDSRHPLRQPDAGLRPPVYEPGRAYSAENKRSGSRDHAQFRCAGVRDEEAAGVTSDSAWPGKGLAIRHR